MSAFDYNRTAQTALRLLQRYGKATTLTREAPGEYDPDDAAAPITPTVQNVVAAVFPVEQKYVDGTLVRSTDEQALISARGVSEPKPGDILLWGGRDLTAVKCQNLGPAGVFVLYEIIIGAR